MQYLPHLNETSPNLDQYDQHYYKISEYPRQIDKENYVGGEGVMYQVISTKEIMKKQQAKCYGPYKTHVGGCEIPKPKEEMLYDLPPRAWTETYDRCVIQMEGHAHLYGLCHA